MKNLFVKIICGYEKDQQFSIPAEEAHKAYYIFLHPEERTVFNNGLAIIGKQIQSIAPDYNETMGWNHTYELGDDDWADIRGKEVDRKLREVLFMAKEVARLGDKHSLSLPLSEAIPHVESLPEDKQKQLEENIAFLSADKFKI